MSENLTIPDIEAALRKLNPGEAFALDGKDYVHLFGVNDAARGRMVNFARSHNCAPIWSGNSIRLRKLPPKVPRT